MSKTNLRKLADSMHNFLNPLQGMIKQIDNTDYNLAVDDGLSEDIFALSESLTAIEENVKDILEEFKNRCLL